MHERHLPYRAEEVPGTGNVIDHLAELIRVYHFDSEKAERQDARSRVETLIQRLGEDKEVALYRVFNILAIEGVTAVVAFLNDPRTIHNYETDKRVEVVHAVKRLGRMTATDPTHESDTHITTHAYPFSEHLQFELSDPVAVMLQNIGHDALNIPAFSQEVLSEVIEFSISTEQVEYLHAEDLRLLIAPHLLYGAQLIFEGYLGMMTGEYPAKYTSLTQILCTICAETVARAGLTRHMFMRQPHSLEWNGVEYVCQKKDGLKIELETEVEEDMELISHAGALHFPIYQLIKNSIGFFRDIKNKEQETQHLRIVARTVEINGHQLYAVLVDDDGPGLSIESLWRSRQSALLEKAGATVNGVEKNSWNFRAIRFGDVADQIFERGVSGQGRTGNHSGIGLSMAQEMISALGNAEIWVTNNVDRPGTRFLLVIDPTPERTVKQAFPTLFDRKNGNEPLELLHSINQQME